MRGVGQQFGLFLVVGALTTTLDFLVYNLLTRRPVGWGRIPANLVSSTVAMTFSFTVNWHFVFHPAGLAWVIRAVKFLAVTCASSYGLQSLVIHFLSAVWRGQVRLAQALAAALPCARRLRAEFVDKNTVKAAAVAVGSLWNFCWYKWFVYAY